MAAFDANTESFELVEVAGIKAIFTCLRIKRDTVPVNMFCYDIRHSDEGAEPCEVAKLVMVNHYGTIITKTPVNIVEGEYFLLDDGDFAFLDRGYSLGKFINEANHVETEGCNNVE